MKHHIHNETGIRMTTCGKGCMHNFSKPNFSRFDSNLKKGNQFQKPNEKYHWTEPTPLFDGSYKNAVEWYKFWQKCEFELRNARMLNDIPKIFIYEQIVPLVKSDGIR